MSQQMEERVVKEALHIYLLPEDQRFNRDVGLKLPGFWVLTIKIVHETVLIIICLIYLDTVVIRHIMDHVLLT